MMGRTPSFRFMHARLGIVTVFLMTVIACAITDAQDQGDLQQSPPAGVTGSDSTSRQSGTAIPPDPGFASIQVLARAAEDSIVLRWAPTTPHGWRIGIRIGYVIERKASDGESVLLTPLPILPWDVEPWGDWLQKDSSNALVGIAVYALYADTTLMGLADSLGRDTVGTNAERNANLFGYALFAADNDPAIATALGLRFVDRTAKRGVRYTYTITLARSQTYRVEPGTVDVATGATAAGPAPKNFVGKGLDGKIQLQWEPSSGIVYSAYNVFRSENHGRTYTKLNATPIAIVVPNDRDVPALGAFLDTTIVNYMKYRYQVKGIDAFGESSVAAEVEAYGRDLTPPPTPMVKNAEQVGAAKLRMRWELLETPNDLAGFNVMRSASADSNYRRLNERLLPSTAREYVDEKADERESYYIISAVDTAGNVSSSFPLYGMLIDTLPPAMPTGLRGFVDSLGHVTLRWNRNREANILGYRVLRANAPEHEFTQLTGSVCRDTVYVDSIEVNTLTRFVYYRIAAVNVRFGHSEMTAPFALRRQKRHMPTAPVFTDVIAGDESVALQWVVNSEDELRSIVLLRRNASPERRLSEPWDTLAILTGLARSYVDRQVVQKITYEYQVAVVDSSGQSIRSELAVQARPFDTGVRPAVAGVTAAYAKESNSVRLDWTYRARETDRVFFVIYRSVDGGEFNTLKSVPGNLRTFTDRGLIGDATYRYRIQAATQGGAESPLSEAVSILVGSPQK
jgi:uncharacterized protein